MHVCVVVFDKKKTAYEMRISNWSSYVCSSDLQRRVGRARAAAALSRRRRVPTHRHPRRQPRALIIAAKPLARPELRRRQHPPRRQPADRAFGGVNRHMPHHLRPRLAGIDPVVGMEAGRSEEHTSELQSLMRISYAVFCLTKKNK